MDAAMPATPPAAPIGFVDVLAAEWIKGRTVRAPNVVALVLVGVFPLFAFVVAVTGSLQPDDTVLGASVLVGAVLAQVLAGALGATLVTAEFRTGSIQPTLLACPRRLTVLGAKAAVAAGVAAVASLLGTGAAFAIGSVMLDRGEHRTGTPLPALLGVAAVMAAVAVLGVAIGTVVRHAAGTIAAVVGVVLAPGLAAPLLGPARPWVGGASLDGVARKLVQSSDATPDAVGSLGAWPSLLVVVAYTAAAAAFARWSLRRRDL